ncbi:Polycystin-2 (Polycystic kidney disease 2 protein homolog) [Durusdinium trenchii]|uniref:Polycystin-2 (Polycystic kidney disease 2 protein homolog) n=1 Tax=Durusdinium trenchii TaxID=1381693 RepID=A0ABP0KME8_9DINO
MASSVEPGKKKKSSRPLFLNRDIVIKRLHHRQQSKKASPMVLLKDIFEETPDKDRFVGDVMFWKFFEDIDANRIYHTNSVEYRNLKVMFFETLFYLVLLASVTLYAYNLQSQDVFESRIEQLDYWRGCDTDGNCRIQKVEDVASFWTWMQTELVPLAYTDDVDAPKVAQIETVFPNSNFPLYWSPRYLSDTRSTVLLGSLRMRQLRVQPNVGCSVTALVQHVYPDCYSTYDVSRQSQEPYDPRFAPTYLTKAYRWQPVEETQQVGYDRADDNEYQRERHSRSLSESARLLFPFRTLYQFFRYGWNFADMVILGSFYVHLGFRISAYVAVGNNPALQPDVVGHPEVFMPFGQLMEPLVLGNNLLALLSITCWVKLFKYLCMSSYFRLLVRILESCAARLIIFAALLLVVFFGFAVAFSIGLGTTDRNFVTIPGSFLVLFFLLIDGYSIDIEWFRPGKERLCREGLWKNFVFRALIYFVLLNIFVAIVLDTFSLASRLYAVEANKQNPMIVFLRTYWNWMKGQSLVKDESEEHMNPKDLSITLDLLPGLVRRKWVEKKRRMQRVADENFAGMDLFPEDVDRSLSKKRAEQMLTDWMLPSTQTDVFDQMTAPLEHKPLALYEIPDTVMNQEISRAQLQRLMDEDSTIPLLLGSKRAVDVIRKFKSVEKEESGQPISAVKAMQGTIFGRIDKLERVKLDDDVPEVPEMTQIAEQMSGAILDLRNQFRVQLTGVIECTAVLFEHLVELTQGLDEVRQNSDGVIRLVRSNQIGDSGYGL